MSSSASTKGLKMSAKMDAGELASKIARGLVLSLVLMKGTKTALTMACCLLSKLGIEDGCSGCVQSKAVKRFVGWLGRQQQKDLKMAFQIACGLVLR